MVVDTQKSSNPKVFNEGYIPRKGLLNPNNPPKVEKKAPNQVGSGKNGK
jgi:hypothetical protein